MRFSRLSPSSTSATGAPARQRRVTFALPARREERTMRRRLGLPFVLVCALAACGDSDLPVAPVATGPASLHGVEARSPAVATARRLVTGLEEAQGSAVGPGKAVYVTAPLTGTIWRVDPGTGALTLFASGLPARNPDPFFIGAGVVDVAFLGHTAYALVTGVGPDLEPGRDDVVGIYRIDGPNSFTVIADIGAYSLANPPEPDFFVPTGFQYSLEPFRGGFLVADAHHNRVLYVTRGGEITELIAFPNVVPTGLAISGNTVYVALAGPIPHLPQDGRVVAFTPKAAAATEVASGAPLLVDVEFGRGRTLFALSQGDWHGEFEGAPADPGTGALVRVTGDGTFTTVVGGLDRPTSLEVIGNTAYVVSLAGEVWTVSDIAGPPYGNAKGHR